MENEHSYNPPPGRSLINEIMLLHDQVMDLVEEQREQQTANLKQF